MFLYYLCGLPSGTRREKVKLIWWQIVTGTTRFYPLTVPDLSEDFHRNVLTNGKRSTFNSCLFITMQTLVRKTEILIKEF